jgi:hypothetical protein
MMGVLRSSRIVWLGIGLLLGTAMAGLWPHTPLHGMATDRSENIIVATGLVEETIEAVFFLDSLTGRLRAVVPSLRPSGDFPYQAMWEANAGRDFTACIQTVNEAASRAAGKGGAAAPALQVPQAPRFLMVTGLMDIRQGTTRLRPGRSVVYVVEANTGIVLTYALQWSQQMHNSNQPLSGALTLWAAGQFPTAAIRAQE